MTHRLFATVSAWHGRPAFPATTSMPPAETRHEVFSRSGSSDGKRLPVEFSHDLLTHIHINNTKKGAHRNLSLSAGGASRHLSPESSTQEVTEHNSFFACSNPEHNLTGNFQNTNVFSHLTTK